LPVSRLVHYIIPSSISLTAPRSQTLTILCLVKKQSRFITKNPTRARYLVARRRPELYVDNDSDMFEVFILLYLVLGNDFTYIDDFDNFSEPLNYTETEFLKDYEENLSVHLVDDAYTLHAMTDVVRESDGSTSSADVEIEDTKSSTPSYDTPEPETRREPTPSYEPSSYDSGSSSYDSGSSSSDSSSSSSSSD